MSGVCAFDLCWLLYVSFKFRDEILLLVIVTLLLKNDLFIFVYVFAVKDFVWARVCFCQDMGVLGVMGFVIIKYS